MKSSDLYRKIHMKTGVDQGLEVLVCEQLRQLTSFFFYKHLGYSKVIEDLEEKENRRRRGSKNKKLARKLIIEHPREGTPFYRLGIRAFQGRVP